MEKITIHQAIRLSGLSQSQLMIEMKEGRLKGSYSRLYAVWMFKNKDFFAWKKQWETDKNAIPNVV